MARARPREAATSGVGARSEGGANAAAPTSRAHAPTVSRCIRPAAPARGGVRAKSCVGLAMTWQPVHIHATRGQANSSLSHERSWRQGAGAIAGAQHHIDTVGRVDDE